MRPHVTINIDGRAYTWPSSMFDAAVQGSREIRPHRCVPRWATLAERLRGGTVVRCLICKKLMEVVRNG